MKSLIRVNPSAFCLCTILLMFAGCASESTDNNNAEKENSQASAPNPIKEKEDAPNPNLRRDGNHLSIGYLNVDGHDNNPDLVAGSLVGLDRFHVVGLSSVNKPKKYKEALEKKWPKSFDDFVSKSGKISGDKNQQLMMLYDYRRLYQVSKTELDEYEGKKLAQGDNPAPLAVHFRDNDDDKEFMVVLAHLDEEDPEFRKQQVETLSAWAGKASQPVVLIGTLNLELDATSNSGNESFDAFQQGGTWKWIKPLQMIDTTWMDEDGDGTNDLASQISDFAFVSGRAKGWPATLRILKRSRDFPDDNNSSNHRPFELILDTK